MKNKFNNEILKRAMMAFDCRFVKDFAKLFDISPQNLNGYLHRGTFKDLIRPEAYKRGINIDWIITGEGSKTFGHGTGTRISEPISEYNHSGSISDSLAKTAAILESKSIFSHALSSNIEAFHYALIIEKKLNIAIDKIEVLEEWKKSVEKRLPPVVNGS